MVALPFSESLGQTKTGTLTVHAVFVTAYDEFALDAFEREAVDYLVKPVDDDRLARTVSRLKRTIDGPSLIVLIKNEAVLLCVLSAIPSTFKSPPFGAASSTAVVTLSRSLSSPWKKSYTPLGVPA